MYAQKNACRVQYEYEGFLCTCTCTCVCHRLKAPPETLDQLGDSLRLLDQLQGEMVATENEFEPLR